MSPMPIPAERMASYSPRPTMAASATSNFVSYVRNTGASDLGGGVAVAGGNIYLTGTTTDTLPGQIRSAANTHNMFVAQLSSNGTLNWAQQYGGARTADRRAWRLLPTVQGSSVLDALKLQRGTIFDQSGRTPSESQTAARAGDYFHASDQRRDGHAQRQGHYRQGRNASLSCDQDQQRVAVRRQGHRVRPGGGPRIEDRGESRRPGSARGRAQGFRRARGAGIEAAIAHQRWFGSNRRRSASTSTGKVTDNAAVKTTARFRNGNGQRGEPIDTASTTPQIVGLGASMAAVDLLSKQTASRTPMSCSKARCRLSNRPIRS